MTNKDTSTKEHTNNIDNIDTSTHSLNYNINIDPYTLKHGINYKMRLYLEDKNDATKNVEKIENNILINS